MNAQHFGFDVEISEEDFSYVITSPEGEVIFRSDAHTTPDVAEARAFEIIRRHYWARRRVAEGGPANSF